MTSTQEDDKPWKTDLARKASLRREQVLHEIEEAVKKAPSFEEALRHAAEIMKKRFGRYTAVTAYVADGEDWRCWPRSIGRKARSGSGLEAGPGRRRPRTLSNRRLGSHEQRPLGGRGPLERERAGRPGADRRGALGDSRDLERLPRRVHARTT
jgi:hypothetical protein